MALNERRDSVASKDCSGSVDSSNGGGEEAKLSLDETKDQNYAWAQHIFESQYIDLSNFSPRGLISPRLGDGVEFPDLGTICSSPMFSDQLNFLRSWSPRVPPNSEVVWSPRVNNEENSESVSTSTHSGESEPASSNPMVTSDSAASGSREETKKSRKRTTVECASEGSNISGVEDSQKRKRNNSSLIKQIQKSKGPKRLREPRYAIKTRTEVDVMEDGYKWRKYGQKPVKNSPYPRNYYRCTTAHCPVRKRVERSTEDPGLVITSYEGTHSHPKINQPKNSSEGDNPTFEAESLQESISQLQKGLPAMSSVLPNLTASQDSLGLLPNLDSLLTGWPSLMNRAQQPPSLQDNMSFIMAYQIVRLQFELQARAQQLMRYNAAQQSLAGGMPKNLFSIDPQGFSQSALPELLSLVQNYTDLSGGSNQVEPNQIPKPEPVMPSSLLARRANAARLRTSSLNPNAENLLKRQQFMMQQSMAGPNNAGPPSEQNTSGPDQAPGSAPSS